MLLCPQSVCVTSQLSKLASVYADQRAGAHADRLWFLASLRTAPTRKRRSIPHRTLPHMLKHRHKDLHNSLDFVFRHRERRFGTRARMDTREVRSMSNICGDISRMAMDVDNIQ